MSWVSKMKDVVGNVVETPHVVESMSSVHLGGDVVEACRGDQVGCRGEHMSWEHVVGACRGERMSSGHVVGDKGTS